MKQKCGFTLVELLVVIAIIAILAATILLIATNAGLIGISRLAFSLGSNKLVPPALSKVHSRFITPYIAIIAFSLIAIVILLPGFFTIDVFAEMGALYAVGALLAFMFAHASIISLRIRRPELPRPFKLGWNIHIKGRELPISAIIGFLSTFLIWLVILFTEQYSRWVGLGWMVGGLIIYYFYQRHRKKDSMVRKPDNQEPG